MNSKNVTILLTILLLVPLFTKAEQFPSACVTKKDIIYHLYEDGHAGVAGHKSDKETLKEIWILDEIKHKSSLYKVTCIEPYAFKGKDIQSVMLPTHPLDSLLHHALAGAKFRCNPLVIDMDSIGSEAFEGTTINLYGDKTDHTIFLGSHFRSFAPDAFSNMQGLGNLKISPDNQFYTAKDGMLLSKTDGTLLCMTEIYRKCVAYLHTISGSDYIYIPEDIEDIGKTAYYHYNVRNEKGLDVEYGFVIPPHVNHIRKDALAREYAPTIVCLSHIPPVAIDGVINSKAFKLLVPPLAVKAYKEAEGWKAAESIGSITDESLLSQCDEPLYDPMEFDPYDLASLRRSAATGNPYAAYHLADYAFMQGRFAHDYDVRETWLNEERKWLTEALAGLQKITRPANEAIYHFYLGQVWDMISIPEMGGGAFEETDSYFEPSFGNALAEYQKAGELGYAAGYREMGKMWCMGWPTGGSGGFMVDDNYAPDFEKGEKLLLKADEMGDPEAKAALGLMLFYDGRSEEGLTLIEEGLKGADLNALSTYAYERATMLDDAEIEVYFKRVTGWDLKNEYEFANVAGNSNTPSAQMHCAEIFRNGSPELLSLEKALEAYYKVANNPQSGIDGKGYALWDCGELEFWLNPGDGVEDIKAFKKLATDPLFKNTVYANRAKAWLGKYYEEVHFNTTESNRWFAKIDWKLLEEDGDPFTLYLIHEGSQTESLRTKAKQLLRDAAYHDRNEALYYFAMTLRYDDKSEKKCVSEIINQLKAQEAYKYTPYAEALILWDIDSMEELKYIYEESFSPILKAAYGRYLIDERKDVNKGIALLEEACTSDYIYGYNLRSANNEASYYARRDVWMAYLAQLYGQDGEQWGSDDMSVPKIPGIYNRDKALRWQEFCNKISWNGPSGW